MIQGSSRSHLEYPRRFLSAPGCFLMNSRNHEIWVRDDVSALQIQGPEAICCAGAQCHLCLCDQNMVRSTLLPPVAPSGTSMVTRPLTPKSTKTSHVYEMWALRWCPRLWKLNRAKLEKICSEVSVALLLLGMEIFLDTIFSLVFRVMNIEFSKIDLVSLRGCLGIIRSCPEWLLML